MKPYIAIGYVLAGKLPARHLEFPNVLITHASHGLDSAPPRRPVLEKADRRGQNVAEGWPADLLIYSEWRISCRVDARNSDEAYGEVTGKLLPPIVAALACESSEPVFIEITTVGIEQPDGRIDEAWSLWEGFSRRGYAPSMLGGTASNRALETAEVVARDVVARAAARDLTEAMRLRAVGGTVQPVVRASLLHFFFVLEGVSREVGRKADDDRFDSERDRLVAQLTTKLAGTPGTKKATGAIQSTAQKLSALEQRHLRDQIEATGERFGLDQAVVKEALRFATLRNKHLGHATRAATRSLEEFKGIDGEKLARAFLFPYIDLLRKRQGSA